VTTLQVTAVYISDPPIDCRPMPAMTSQERSVSRAMCPVARPQGLPELIVLMTSVLSFNLICEPVGRCELD